MGATTILIDRGGFAGPGGGVTTFTSSTSFDTGNQNKKICPKKNLSECLKSKKSNLKLEKIIVKVVIKDIVQPFIKKSHIG